jgi:hypothetical protein
MNTFNNNELETRVNAALSSLDSVQRATPKPYFYTRVRARLEEQSNPWSKVARIMSQPVWAFSAAALFVTLNVLVAFNIDNGNNSDAAKANEIDMAFDTEYAVVNYSLEANK